MTTYIYFISAIFLIIIGLLLIYNWKYNKNIMFLALFLGLTILEFFIVNTLYFDGNLSLMHIFTLFLPLLFLKSPLLYFYFRGIVYDCCILKKRDILHILPFAFYLIFNLPYLTSVSSHDSLMLSGFELQPDIYKSIKLSFYPIAWNNIALSIQLMVYIVWCFSLLSRSHKISRSMFAQYKYQYRYIVQKLYFILLILLIISGLDIINDFIYPYSSTDNYLIHIILFMYGLLPFYFLLNPKLLYGLPHVETTHISATNLDKLKEGADGM